MPKVCEPFCVVYYYDLYYNGYEFLGRKMTTINLDNP